MEYRRVDQQYFIRLDRGDEVLTQLTILCQQENITAGMITGIGATDLVTMGVYDVSQQQYHRQDFSGEFEIINLSGTISRHQGQPYLHAHITCSDRQYKAFGGHLNYCRISGTGELLLTVVPLVVGRRYDEPTGLNVMDFEN